LSTRHPEKREAGKKREDGKKKEDGKLGSWEKDGS
jgi:hypothetical protein